MGSFDSQSSAHSTTPWLQTTEAILKGKIGLEKTIVKGQSQQFDIHDLGRRWQKWTPEVYFQMVDDCSPTMAWK